MPDTNEEDQQPTGSDDSTPVAESTASADTPEPVDIPDDLEVDGVDASEPELEPEALAEGEGEPESVPVADESFAQETSMDNEELSVADATETAVMDPVAAGDTQVMSSVPTEQGVDAAGGYELDALVAAQPEAHDSARDEAPVDELTNADAVGSSRRNALGVWAVITGALLLFPIALVLGHLGLRASKLGDANNKRVALAGVILGYIGLAAALVGTALALFVVWPNVDAQNTHIAEQSDVITLGNELGAAAADGVPPYLWDVDAAWEAGKAAGTMMLDSAPGYGISGENATQWCLAISDEGGYETQASYSATEGLLADGANCGVSLVG